MNSRTTQTTQLTQQMDETFIPEQNKNVIFTKDYKYWHGPYNTLVDSNTSSIPFIDGMNNLTIYRDDDKCIYLLCKLAEPINENGFTKDEWISTYTNIKDNVRYFNNMQSNIDMCSIQDDSDDEEQFYRMCAEELNK